MKFMAVQVLTVYDNSRWVTARRHKKKSIKLCNISTPTSAPAGKIFLTISNYTVPVSVCPQEEPVDTWLAK